MKYCPVSQSIIDTSHLGNFLQAHYQFGNNVSCQLIKTWVNDTYLIEDNSEKYIFRIYRLEWRTKKEIEEELRWINLLKQKNISVSFPIQDQNKNYIQSFNAPEGKRFGVLFSFAEGEKQLNISPKLHFDIGKMMGQIHQISEGLQLDRITYTPQVLLIDSFKKIEKQLISNSPEFDFLKNTQQQLFTFFEKIKRGQIRSGPIHLDIWADNLNINYNNNITLFDFDFCGNGHLALDIAYHATMLFIFEPNQEKMEEKLQQFYQGYESVLVISEEEKKAIPAFGTALLFFYLGFQCERFSAIFVNKFYVKGFINSRIKRWVEFNQDFDTNQSK
ncbi:MAG: phosphotransferase [Saprospiraceae bacterium]